MSDLIGALVAAVKADPATAAIVNANVFGEELPAEIAAQMPLHALVIASSGGVSLTPASDVEADTQRIDLFAYGPTPRQANQLLVKAARAMRTLGRQTIAGTLIYWVNSAGGYSSARERDGRWPQSFQSFQVFYSLKEVL